MARTLKVSPDRVSPISFMVAFATARLAPARPAGRDTDDRTDADAGLTGWVGQLPADFVHRTARSGMWGRELLRAGASDGGADHGSYQPLCAE